ncbi:glycosyltransferase family 4 protein [Parvibaculum sp.]|uniref:glycosyltransferase family 4 protein n=1 Tax=Parvibaculum sp. TaxID=2024848 RepID=UPI003297872A
MIVFCHLLNDRSGSPTVLRATLDALDAREGGLLFVGSQGRGILEEAGVPIRRYWYRRSPYRIITLFTYFASQAALYRALRHSRDIPLDATVFVNTLLPFAAMFWGRRTGRRVVVHIHEVSIRPEALRRFLTACAARCADLLLYVSHDHCARLPIDGPPARVVPNPVSPALAVRADTRLPRQDGLFRVLMLASLRSYKGVEEFITLAAALRDRSDIAFDLVLNAEPGEVDAFAARHAGAGNVTIYPRTDDPASFYTRADLVLNLARVDQWIETFGLTLVEAMSFDIPVIAPPVGGPAEIVTNGVEGYCIDSRDGAALRDAVLKLADDPEAYNAMAQAARKRAQHFTFDAYAIALCDALNSLGKGQVK